MAGPTKSEKAKLRRLDKKARKLDDPMVTLDHATFILMLNDKYGEGTVENPYDVYNKGGMVKKAMGASDYRKGGMVLSTVDNRKKK